MSVMLDRRVELSSELLPEHAQAALANLDRTTVVVRSGDSVSARLTAAALVALLVRTHARVDVALDVALPTNPWGAKSLTQLLEMLSPVRPTPLSDETERWIVATDAAPDADRYVAPGVWTVAVTNEPCPVPDESDHIAPFGGMVGAALVASELFWRALGPLGAPHVAPREAFVWNLINFQLSPAPPDAVAALTERALWPSTLFAGTGSVATSTAAVLACGDLTGMTGVAADGDAFDPTKNPFRYPALTGGEVTAKVTWIVNLLASRGATVTPHQGTVASWVVSQAAPGFDGVVVSTVDTVDGRYEVADVLARTTLSGAVDGLLFHVQREHLGDGLQCPFCEYVATTSSLGQAAADSRLTGMPEQRIAQLLFANGLTDESDVAAMVAAGKVMPSTEGEYVGKRIEDLRARLYAQITIPTSDDSAPQVKLSAPFVSWMIGALLAAEVGKMALGLPAVDRRIEVDMHGYPGDIVHRYDQDTSGGCACARVARTRAMRRMYLTPSSVELPGQRPALFEMRSQAAPG